MQPFHIAIIGLCNTDIKGECYPTIILELKITTNERKNKTMAKKQQDGNILELEIALQDGITVNHVGDRLKLSIDTTKTKRDLWVAQMEMWVSQRGDVRCISSGYLRIENSNKLSFTKWK